MNDEGNTERLTPAERLALQALVDWDKAGHHGPEYHNLALAATAYRLSQLPALITKDVALWFVSDDDNDIVLEPDVPFPAAVAGRLIILHPDGTWEEGR